MAHHHHHRSARDSWGSDHPGLLSELWRSFWNPPDTVCPKCGSPATEYYDPFFFALQRTLTGKRRIKCTACHFIWRPSRRGKSLWERFKPVV
jgi:hypothetical protein